MREWVDDKSATPADLDALTVPDEQAWDADRKRFLLTPDPQHDSPIVLSEV